MKILWLSLLFLFIPTTQADAAESIISPPIYSILDTIKMKDPLSVTVDCTELSYYQSGYKDHRQINIRETFNAILRNHRASEATATLLEYHTELHGNWAASPTKYYCYTFTNNDNIVK